METDDVRAKEHIDKLNGKLDAYEAILKKQKYLGGDVSVTSCTLLPLLREIRYTRLSL